MTDLVLNIRSDSPDWRAALLSNLALTPFVLDHVLCSSVEGLVQGIKFPPTDNRREPTFALWGMSAKKMGVQALRTAVWWKGEKIVYRSQWHESIISRGIRAKLCYNEGARMALLATQGLTLTHDLGPEDPRTSLRADLFCTILNELRHELSTKGTLRPP